MAARAGGHAFGLSGASAHRSTFVGPSSHVDSAREDLPPLPTRVRVQNPLALLGARAEGQFSVGQPSSGTVTFSPARRPCPRRTIPATSPEPFSSSGAMPCAFICALA